MMFVRDKELESEVKYLHGRIDDERGKRWALEEKLARLMAHLGLEEVQVPPAVVIRKAETVAGSREGT